MPASETCIRWSAEAQPRAAERAAPSVSESPAGGHRGLAREDVPGQLLLRCGACSVYRRGDAASARGDRFVRSPLQPPVELRLAKTGEGDVRVRVDEARNGRGAARIEVLIDDAAKIGIDIGFASDKRKTAVANDDDGVIKHRDLAHRLAAG